jgi:NADH-quinone oxidoreductase subunit M
MQQYLLSSLIFTPLVAALIILFIPGSHQNLSKHIALIISIIQCILLTIVVFNFSADGSLQFVERKTWISLDLGSWGTLQAEYFLALDGLNLSLVALSIPVMLIATIASWSVTKNIRGYFVLLLILNS